jgi:adenine-specific DNA-methyltransferase
VATKKSKEAKTVVTLTHEEASRKNIPTAEFQSVMPKDEQSPIRVAYERRNRDLDPQLVWRGKDEQDWSDLVVHAPPLYIQEKVHPKVLVDDLLRRTASDQKAAVDQYQLFADFNGLPSESARTEFYQHDANWTNRMILGDSLQVMASLTEREGLRGKVQCIYLDPPYGIKFNSNFQWSTTSRDVKDGNVDHITREPEQVKAFRDTWRFGVHSYLSYLRDRLAVSRELLTDSGSIFVQIGDENVHRVRAVLDEVFSEDNFVANLYFRKTGSHSDNNVGSALDIILWYARNVEAVKVRKLARVEDLPPVDEKYYVNVHLPDGESRRMTLDERLRRVSLPEGSEVFRYGPVTGQGPSDKDGDVIYLGRRYPKKRNRHWSTHTVGMLRLAKAGRLLQIGNDLSFDLRWKELPKSLGSVWEDTQSGGFGAEKVYVVETTPTVIERCILMASDPGELVLDPTCGSGTTAFVAEQRGRRWITIDTSRVALALARKRIMGARFPYYLLADSPGGQLKEAEVTGREPSTASTRNDLRHGFVYERLPHVQLSQIANNTEIDVIWDKFQQALEPLRQKLNQELKQTWEEWEIPRDAEDRWSKSAKELHAEWWKQRIARQKEIDASIAAKAEYEYLYDKPYEDNKKVRVAGPFTVESLSPHRALAVDENDELIRDKNSGPDFVQVILENLKTAGVQQAHKEDKIVFSSLTP